MGFSLGRKDGVGRRKEFIFLGIYWELSVRMYKYIRVYVYILYYLVFIRYDLDGVCFFSL